MARWWAFMEAEAERAREEPELATLLQIECFEGVGWVEDLGTPLGPATRALLRDARGWLAEYNGQIGVWAPERVSRKERNRRRGMG